MGRPWTGEQRAAGSEAQRPAAVQRSVRAGTADIRTPRLDEAQGPTTRLLMVAAELGVLPKATALGAAIGVPPRKATSVRRRARAAGLVDADGALTARGRMMLAVRLEVLARAGVGGAE